MDQKISESLGSLRMRRLMQAVRKYEFEPGDLSLNIHADVITAEPEPEVSVTAAPPTPRGEDGVLGEVFQNEAFYRLYQILIPAVFTFIILIGLLGNCLVIYVIASRRRLQTVTNLLLLNLAVADVSFSVVCGGFSVAHYALTEWPLGETVCRLIQYLLYITCYVMVYTLMAVSGVRYLSVVHGTRANIYLTRRNISLLILGIWAAFIVAKTPVLMVHSVTYDPRTNRTECIIIGKQEAREFFASFFIFAYALPLLVICTLYLKVITFLRHRHSVSRSPAAAEERKRHVTKIVARVVAVFAICWLPLHIHLLVAYYGVLPETPTYKLLLIVWHSLVYINSLLNPIIYNYFSEDFRGSFLEVVRCRGWCGESGQEGIGPGAVDTTVSPALAAEKGEAVLLKDSRVQLNLLSSDVNDNVSL